MYGGKHRDVETEPARVEQPAIAQDVAFLFQGPDAAQAGRRRNSNTPGQFDVGDSTVSLDFAQDFEVDFVKVLGHVNSGFWDCRRSIFSLAWRICAILLRVRRVKSRSAGENSPRWIAILAWLATYIDLELKFRRPPRCLS